MTAAVTAPGGRRHAILTAVLAVAIVAVGGSAAGTLVRDALAAAPAVVAPAPAPVAPAVPAPAPVPAPAVVDTTDRPLPPEVAAGVGRLATALSAGDPAAVRPLYVEGGVGAPWTQVQAVLADPAARAGLSTALRAAPERRSGVFVYQAGGFRLGVDPQGRLAFLQAP